MSVFTGALNMYGCFEDGSGVCKCGDSFPTHMAAEKMLRELRMYGSSIQDVSA